MQLLESELAIRPRTPWEAVDLGVALAHRHAGILLASWALLTLPIEALLTWQLWRHPFWALFLFWLIKPLFEPLPLYILSRAIFGQRPTLGQALRAWPGQLRYALRGNLLLRRLAGSFQLPMAQLEGQRGSALAQRRLLLGHHQAGSTAVSLTLLGASLEVALLMGLWGLLLLLWPRDFDSHLQWIVEVINLDLTALPDYTALPLWLLHLQNLLYALVLTFWEPIYVACGFCLYLNSRTRLEAWDIELVFRRLAQRLGGALALLLALLITLPSPAALAAEPAPANQQPQAQQQLSPQDAQKDIKQLLDQPPFVNKVTIPRLSSLNRHKPQPARLPELEWLPRVAEMLLWIALMVLVVALAQNYRQWLQLFAEALPRRRQRLAAQVRLEPLAAATALPGNIADRAEHLWDQDPRGALGLLYRAFLARLADPWQLMVQNSQTENEVLARLAQLHNGPLLAYGRELTQTWQNLTYGHRPPPSQAKQALCDGWRALFERSQAHE